MLPVLIQLVTLLAAGFVLHRLTRSIVRGNDWVTWSIAAGFLVRAVAGQILFWISWAELPIARSLQIGDGLWFFALDADIYMSTAIEAANGGLPAIATIRMSASSVVFVKLLALAIWLFGSFASTGLLLNLFAFAGTIALIRRWAARDGDGARVIGIVVAVVSLSPSGILWSLQPLKDTVFQFFFVAFVAGCAALRHAWRNGAAPRITVASMAAIVVSVYAISGIRWYVGIFMLASATLFFALEVLRTRTRRLYAAAGALVLLFAIRTAILASAGPYVPANLRPFLGSFSTERPPAASSTKPSRPATAAAPSSLVDTVVLAREGFDRSGGGTTIQPGRLLAPEPETDAGAAPPVVRAAAAAAPPQTPAPAAQTAAVAPSAAPTRGEPRALRPIHVVPSAEAPLSPAEREAVTALIRGYEAALERGDTAAGMSAYWQSPDLELQFGRTRIVGWNAAQRAASAMRDPQHQRLLISMERMRVIAPGRIIMTGKVSTAGGHGPIDAELRQVPGEGWKISRVIVPQAAAAENGGGVRRHAVRLLSGLAAIVVPQHLAMAIGLFDVGGGRGMLWFTDLATIVFDIVLVFAIVTLVRRFRDAVRNPLVWCTAAMTALLAGPLAYTVSNWGTLFRLREMIFTALVLLCVAVAKRSEPVEA